MSLNCHSCFPHISFDLNVFLFQEDFKCTENQKQICCPLDTEIERTLRNLRKLTSAESTSMTNQRERLQPIREEVETNRPQRQMTMEDFWRPVIQDEYSAVRQPAIKANNFELKPAMISMVQQH